MRLIKEIGNPSLGGTWGIALFKLSPPQVTQDNLNKLEEESYVPRDILRRFLKVRGYVGCGHFGPTLPLGLLIVCRVQ
ncbi:hypothetical protein SK128_012360 [Halocaridina rubra]|uniref:Uncharacterized protein n=1 Tax=Halocaridina rubra TaxID=373956 RepID=A0AAN9AF39_HALRR